MATDRPADSPVSPGSMYGFNVRFTFPVHFTRGLWSPANPLFVDTVRRLEPQRRHTLFIVIDDGVAAAHPRLTGDIGAYVAHHADALRLACDPVVIPGGEPSKQDLQQVSELLRRFDEAGLDRQSVVAVIGGGAVLDVVSFAAAIAHRGIRTIRIPTTVLSQDDSGIAVKTSVNMFGKKNFSGTFTPPFAVINDFAFLETLTRRQRGAGLAEAVKVALLKEPALFEFIEAHAAALAEGEPAALEHVVRRSAELHLDHICGNGDPFEQGSARPLDFGHWCAHKLETLTAHRVSHGEAVAIGMAVDLRYAVGAGYLRAEVADRILAVLDTLGLPRWDRALAETNRDGHAPVLRGLQEFREHLGGELHVTMLRDIGSSFEVTAMDERLVLDAIAALEPAAPSTPGAMQHVTAS